MRAEKAQEFESPRHCEHVVCWCFDSACFLKGDNQAFKAFTDSLKKEGGILSSL